MHSMLMRWPMTPVDATDNVVFRDAEAQAAAAFAMRRAFSMPSGAQALALPAVRNDRTCHAVFQMLHGDMTAEPP